MTDCGAQTVHSYTVPRSTCACVVNRRMVERDWVWDREGRGGVVGGWLGSTLPYSQNPDFTEAFVGYCGAQAWQAGMLLVANW
jgi:hypothetical protein